MSQQSNHLPGDVAPLPSPDSRTGPADHYFSAFPSTQSSYQSQHPHYMTQPSSTAQYATESSLPQQQQPQHLQTPLAKQSQSNPALSQPQSSGPLQHPESTQQQAQHSQPGFATDPLQHQQSQPCGSSTRSEANIHLRDFSLLAEAAKRAQVAVVTRDMEEISL